MSKNTRGLKNERTKVLVTLVIVALLFCTTTSSAAVTTWSALDGAKMKDSNFVASSQGKFVTLTMSCTATSDFGTMEVIRGKKTSPSNNLDYDVVWLMYPALKCGVGKYAEEKKNIDEYAKTHEGGAYANFFSVRHYGNHCDNQKTGCYGTARATNTSQ